MLTETEPTPGVVAAVAALSSLRDAYPYLVTVAEAEAYGLRRDRTSGNRPPIGARAKERNDELLRTERAERVHADRLGIRQSGASASPIRPALLDAELLATSTVRDQAWIVGSALRRLDTWLSPVANLTGNAGWTQASTYLAVHIHDVDDALAGRAAVELGTADRAVRSACGLADVRIPIPGSPECPCCGRRALRIDVTSPEQRDWTVACRPDCLCRGQACACKRPGRRIAQIHRWSALHFGSHFGLLRTLHRLAQVQQRAARSVAA